MVVTMAGAMVVAMVVAVVVAVLRMRAGAPKESENAAMAFKVSMMMDTNLKLA